MELAQRSGGLEPMLDAVFSFMKRKTDLYVEQGPGDRVGFPPGEAQKIVLRCFSKFASMGVPAPDKKALETIGMRLQGGGWERGASSRPRAVSAIGTESAASAGFWCSKQVCSCIRLCHCRYHSQDLSPNVLCSSLAARHCKSTSLQRCCSRNVRVVSDFERRYNIVAIVPALLLQNALCQHRKVSCQRAPPRRVLLLLFLLLLLLLLLLLRVAR